MKDRAIDRTGWVPSRFTWIGGQGFVDWTWIGNQRFTAPFFDDVIEKAQTVPFNRLFAHCSPISELVRWYSASPGLEPSGFIFHMSRCGSTLVSQMLAALHDCVVISEAGPIDRIARAFAIPEQTRALWLRSMVSALGQKWSGRETRYFIKFDSVTILAARFIRRVFPGVPWIFLYRNPEEVLVSHLRMPAPAMAPGFINDVSLVEAPIAEAPAMPPEEHAACAIGRLCANAHQVIDERGMLVNYTELPEAVFGRLADHFALDLSADEIGTMKNTALFNAKRPRQKFEADGEKKRLELSEAGRVASNRWILPHYEELERIRLATRTSLTGEDHRVTDLAARIIEFVMETGLEVRTETIREKTQVPGIVIHHGALVVDPAQWLYPGDLLHEAGHLAVMEPDLRKQCHVDVGNDAAEEMMAIAWSYAACIHLGLSPSIVFHEGGYRGGSQALIENFSQGRYIAVPMLQWLGMAAELKSADTMGVEPYPHMLRWLR